jgi:hypothetical protein
MLELRIDPEAITTRTTLRSIRAQAHAHGWIAVVRHYQKPTACPSRRGSDAAT